jgi:DNA-binding beta-propeller fold protein YncE
LYVDLEDKDKVAVVDTKTWKVIGTYDLAGKGGTPAGLAMDVKNRVLFVACRNPATMVMLNADTGAIVATLPLGAGTDGATFNPATMEAFSSQGDGTLTIIKEKTPTTFEVEQTVQTPPRSKTLTLDAKTNRIILITAEFAAPPAPPADAPAVAAPVGGRGGRGPRAQMVPGSFSIVVVGK